MNPRVVLVTGPPCSGKSTYVDQHKGPHDVVLDRDYLSEATYQGHIKAIVRGAVDRACVQYTVWVIACIPTAKARTEYVQQIWPHHHVHLAPPYDVLIERAHARHNARSHVRAVHAYMRADQHIEASSTGHDPEPKSRGWWH